jgi:hypothetical protein
MVRGIFYARGGFVHPASRRNINLAADDWFYPGLLHFKIKLNGAEHVSMVGNSQGIHLVFMGKIY